MTQPVFTEETLLTFETNIDDMPPSHYECVMEALFEAGALDVYIQPILMKKNRPAHILFALGKVELKETLLHVFFKHTSTLGVRIDTIKRISIARTLVIKQTRFGPVQLKETNYPEKRLAPEYDDCKAIAQSQGIPLKTVIDQVMIDVYNNI